MKRPEVALGRGLLGDIKARVCHRWVVCVSGRLRRIDLLSFNGAGSAGQISHNSASNHQAFGLCKFSVH